MFHAKHYNCMDFCQLGEVVLILLSPVAFIPVFCYALTLSPQLCERMACSALWCIQNPWPRALGCAPVHCKQHTPWKGSSNSTWTQNHWSTHRLIKVSEHFGVVDWGSGVPWRHRLGIQSTPDVLWFACEHSQVMNWTPLDIMCATFIRSQLVTLMK